MSNPDKTLLNALAGISPGSTLAIPLDCYTQEDDAVVINESIRRGKGMLLRANDRWCFALTPDGAAGLRNLVGEGN